MRHHTTLIATLGAFFLVACDNASDAGAKSAAPASASAASQTKASGAPTQTAAATGSSAPTAAASAATPSSPVADLFSGAPSFDGKTKPRVFQGITFDMTSDLKDFDDPTANLVGFNNPPGTVKARLWLSKADARVEWATAAKMAETEKQKTGEVTQGGKSVGKVAVPSACESSVFEAVGVPIPKIQWVGEPKNATFGEAKSPGAFLEAKDADGKWSLYCVRIAVSDKLGVVGGIGFRTDKGDADAKLMTNVIKSVRAAKP